MVWHFLIYLEAHLNGMWDGWVEGGHVFDVFLLLHDLTK